MAKKKKASKRNPKPVKARVLIRKPDEFDVRHSLDTLVRAEEIKKDKKLMKLVDGERKARLDALNNIKKG